MGKHPVDLSPLKALCFFTQVGLSFCVPLVLCIWGACVLRSRLGMGNGIVLAGILVGLYAGISGFAGVLRSMNRMVQSSRKEDGHE